MNVTSAVVPLKLYFSKIYRFFAAHIQFLITSIQVIHPLIPWFMWAINLINRLTHGGFQFRNIFKCNSAL